MKALIKFFIVIFFFSFLPLMPLQAAEASPTPVLADGTYKPKKKRKVVKKKVAKAPLTSSVPRVGISGSAESKQLVFSIEFVPLTSQLMKQEGNKIVALQKDGKTAALFDNPKDQQIAESIIKSLKTEEAFFLSMPATSRKPSLNIIALNKASWTEADVAAARKLIQDSFAPVQVIFTITTANFKPLLIPSSSVGINTLNQ